MTDALKQTTKEELAKLPKEMQEAISSVDWMNISEEIGKKYLIDENEVNIFQAVTLVILAGMIDLNLYQKNIENEVGTSSEEAKKIVEEATRRIFVPIINKRIDAIKKNLENKQVGWKEGLDFVLSGGDYSVFLRKKDPSSSSDRTEADTHIRTSKIDDLKNKFTI